jgi:hypothetical protein
MSLWDEKQAASPFHRTRSAVERRRALQRSVAMSLWDEKQAGPRSIAQGRINMRGELFLEPSFWTEKAFPGDPPRRGPIVIPSLRRPDQYNRLSLSVGSGRLDIAVNGTPVCETMSLDWLYDIQKLELATFCERGKVRAEFDRIEVRELSPEKVATASRAPGRANPKAAGLR